MKFHVGLGKQLEKLIGPWGLSDLEMPHGTPHLISRYSLPWFLVCTGLIQVLNPCPAGPAYIRFQENFN